MNPLSSLPQLETPALLPSEVYFLSSSCLDIKWRKNENELRKPASFARPTRQNAMAFVHVGSASSGRDPLPVLIHPTNAYTDDNGDGERTWAWNYPKQPIPIQQRMKNHPFTAPTLRFGAHPIMVMVNRMAFILRSQNYPVLCVIRKGERVRNHQCIPVFHYEKDGSSR